MFRYILMMMMVMIMVISVYSEQHSYIGPGIIWFSLEFYLCTRKALREAVLNHYSYDELKC